MPEKQRRQRRSDGLSVYHRKDGRWEYAVTIGYNSKGNPIRKRGYSKTRAEAVRRGQEVLAAKNSGVQMSKGKDVTVEKWIDTWLQDYIRPTREPKTVRYYEGFCKNHLLPALGRVPLRKLTSNQVQHFLNDLSASGLAPNTVRGIRATLRAAIQQAWRQDLVSQNVAQKTSPPKVARTEPKHLTPDEIKTFLEAIRGNPLENLFVFTLWTGVRLGEATGLTWNNVDLDKGSVAIRNQLQRVDGKLVLKGLKSKSSRRNLPLVGAARESICAQERLNTLNLAHLPAGANGLNLVFLNPMGRPLDQKYVSKHLKRIVASAGLPDISFHALRHTTATMLLDTGAHLHQVKDQLGHSQISLTVDLYGHRVDARQREAALVLDTALRAPANAARTQK